MNHLISRLAQRTRVLRADIRLWLLVCVAPLSLAACHHTGGGGVSSYTVGGAVTGLNGTLSLQNNGGDTLSISANGTFTFRTALVSGSPYSVTISAQPAGQTCTVGNGSGTITGATTNVTVNCATNKYGIGGSITGLTGGGLILIDNGSDSLPISAGATSFTFGTRVAYGGAYAATIGSQPAHQICTLANATGTVAAAVVNIAITCVTTTFSVGGSVAALAVGGLVLANGSDTVTISAGATAFTFPAQVAYGGSYSVTVMTQPSGQVCQVTGGGAGTVTGPINSIVVGCAFGEWTWVGGSNGANASGVYGTRGSASAANAPGARSPASAWSDAAGNFWLFGGYGFDSQGRLGDLNDLWKYSPATGQWTWVSGSNTADASGVYGTRGTASPGNAPGARENGTAWTDSADNFWLFGGFGYSATGAGGDLNDLWKFSPTSGSWTWINGSSDQVTLSGVYGTKGVPSPTNVPGGRDGTAGSWIDSMDNLWLFGGAGEDSTPLGGGALNDLWKYSPILGEWTWISGSNLANPGAVYGTKGTASAANVPGGREDSNPWIDSSGVLWMFGGYGQDSSGTLGDLNDSWSYSPLSNEWTWASGPNTAGGSGIYGTQGVAAPNNLPGARISAASSADPSGNLWLFGGQGFDSSGVGGGLNDLWKYNPTTAQWTWLSGSTVVNAAAVYGTPGTASVNNMPGSQLTGSLWVDPQGNVWLFGGYSIDSSGAVNRLNALWRWTPAK